jgi:drug/metabolite transporter (DMT)-like permease
MPTPLGRLRAVPSERAAAGLLVLGASLWGLTFPAAKEGLEVLGPLALMAWTRAVGFASLLPAGRGTRSEELRRCLPLGGLLGSLVFLAYHFQTLGLERTTATNAGFLTGLYVVGTPLAGALLYRRWPERRTIVAVAISTVGLGLLSLRGWSFSTGDALVLLSVVFWSLHILSVGRGAGRDPVVLFLVQMGVAALLHTVAAGFDLRLEDLDRAWGYLIVTGVLGTGCAYFLQIVGQRRIGPTRTAVIYTSEPVSAAIFSALWLGERLSLRGWLGAGLILGAMLIAVTRARSPVDDQAPV